MFSLGMQLGFGFCFAIVITDFLGKVLGRLWKWLCEHYEVKKKEVEK